NTTPSSASYTLSLHDALPIFVDMPDGSDYGFVMKDSGTIGRMTYISPIIWSNNWPVWGSSNAPGRVPSSAPMPIVGAPNYFIPTDRKSTRLNSSHRTISYAVF